MLSGWTVSILPFVSFVSPALVSGFAVLADSLPDLALQMIRTTITTPTTNNTTPTTIRAIYQVCNPPWSDEPDEPDDPVEPDEAK